MITQIVAAASLS